MTTSPLHTCGKRMIPCVFGFPNDEVMQLARKGKIKLMGCIIRTDINTREPTHWCPYCRRYVYGKETNRPPRS